MFGWLSTICFAISPLFMARAVYRQGHARGISAAFLWFWGLGEVFAILHTAISFGWVEPAWPLYFNYLLNGAGLSIIVWYKLWERVTYD